MIETPDLDRAVFVRALADVGIVRISGTNVECDIGRGDIWILRWSAIKDTIERGDAELI
jgi:GINS complex subunit 4